MNIMLNRKRDEKRKEREREEYLLYHQLKNDDNYQPVLQSNRLFSSTIEPNYRLDHEYQNIHCHQVQILFRRHHVNAPNRIFSARIRHT